MWKIQVMRQVKWNQKAVGLNPSLTSNTFTWFLHSLKVDVFWTQCLVLDMQWKSLVLCATGVCLLKIRKQLRTIALGTCSVKQLQVDPMVTITELVCLVVQLFHCQFSQEEWLEFPMGTKLKMGWYTIKTTTTTNEKKENMTSIFYPVTKKQ